MSEPITREQLARELNLTWNLLAAILVDLPVPVNLGRLKADTPVARTEATIMRFVKALLPPQPLDRRIKGALHQATLSWCAAHNILAGYQDGGGRRETLDVVERLLEQTRFHLDRLHKAGWPRT